MVDKKSENKVPTRGEAPSGVRVSRNRTSPQLGGGTLKKVILKPSTRADKKYMAVFMGSSPHTTKGVRGPPAPEKTVHFGAKGMSDYTKHGDKERKENYIKRHKKRENWNDPKTAGALSRYILWNKPTLRESIKDFEKKFNIDIVKK